MMRGHLYGCGCYVLRGSKDEVLRDAVCSRHAPIGRALNVLRTLAGQKEIWLALERCADAGVRTLAETTYFQVQRSVGELDAVVALEREHSSSTPVTDEGQALRLADQAGAIGEAAPRS